MSEAKEVVERLRDHAGDTRYGILPVTRSYLLDAASLIERLVAERDSLIYQLGRVSPMKGPSMRSHRTLALGAILGAAVLVAIIVAGPSHDGLRDSAFLYRLTIFICGAGTGLALAFILYHLTRRNH